MKVNTLLRRGCGKNSKFTQAITNNFCKASILLLFLIFSIHFCKAQGWYNANWYARKKITIDYTKVSGTQTNFPVLISLNADSDLNTYARSDGFDILFTSSDGTTKLNYDRERYVSGTLVAWVNIPSLSASANTEIYMYYGYSSSSDQQSMNAAWNSNYKGVWHLREASSNGTTGEFIESTSNGNHGTGQSGGSFTTQVDGKIGKAQSFSGDRISISSPNFGLTTKATFSFWHYGDAAVQPANQIILQGRDASNNQVVSLSVPWGDGKIYWDCGNSGGSTIDRVYYTSTSASQYEGQWNYWVCTKDQTTGYMKLYLNGSLMLSGSSLNRTLSTISTFSIGSYNSSGSGGYYYDGLIDEFRISNIEQSAGWVLTEYNNQSSPSTFYSVGSQVLPVDLLYFKSKIENNLGLITWATATEINNDYFTIEKSMDGKSFETIARIKGAGNSQQILTYAFIDSQLNFGNIYYRLKQTDFDGTFSFSDISVVSCCSSANLNTPIKLYPTPASSHLVIEFSSEKTIVSHFYITDIIGNKIIDKDVMIRSGTNNYPLEIGDLPNGIYFIKFEGFNLFGTKKFTVAR